MVTTAHANNMYALGTELGVGSLATKIVLLLLAPVVDLASGLPPLVDGVASNTYQVIMSADRCMHNTNSLILPPIT